MEGRVAISLPKRYRQRPATSEPQFTLIPAPVEQERADSSNPTQPHTCGRSRRWSYASFTRGLTPLCDESIDLRGGNGHAHYAPSKFSRTLRLTRASALRKKHPFLVPGLYARFAT